MPGGAPTPGFVDSHSLTGQGSGFCYQLSEYSPWFELVFTLSGAGNNVSCIDPGVIECGWFVDTGPGGTVELPSGDRVEWDSYAADCMGGQGVARYDNGALSLLGSTSLFLRTWSRDSCGIAYNASFSIGPHNPATNTDIEITANTGTPTGAVIDVTTHDDDSGGELPIGVYRVSIQLIDNVSDQGLDLDNTGITYEVWTKPNRQGKFLAGASGFTSHSVATTPLIVDQDFQDLFNEIAKDASGATRSVQRYVHAFNGGCNDADIATYTLSIEPFKSDVQGEHLVHVICSTNHEENVFYNVDVPDFALQDLRDEVNQFVSATAYRPGEANGLWTWGGSFDASTRAPGNNEDDDDDAALDVGPPNPVTGISPPEDEPGPQQSHWVNIHVEVDPIKGTNTPPGIQAQTCHVETDPNTGDMPFTVCLNIESLTNDINLHCDK